MMKDIAIYGAGGFGREIACLIMIINGSLEQPEWNLIGFFDDGRHKGERNEYGEILGGFDTLNNWDRPLSIVIAIGTPRIVEKIVSNLNNDLIDFPNIIAPDVKYFDKDNCTIGIGNIICTGCLLSCNTHIGNFNQFNGYITIGHDTVIGNFNSMMPGVRISGDVRIGDRNYWGFNSGIIQQKSVGNDVTIGAGSVLLRKPKDGYTYVGIPACMVKF